MLLLGRAFLAPILVSAAFALVPLVPSSPALGQTLVKGGAVKIGDRTLRCGAVPTVFDRNLPMEGAAVIGEALILNPLMLSRHPELVRLFVYHHECGHHRVGGSELKADCHAVEQGVRDGWLDGKDLAAICRSFGSEPASVTHPSGRKRCKNIEKCFAIALVSAPRRPPEVIAAPAASAPPLPKQAFRLVRGPHLVAEGLTHGEAPLPAASILCPERGTRRAAEAVRSGEAAVTCE